jgi:hypothetical protein
VAAGGPAAIGGPSGAILALFLYPLGFALVKGGPAEMWGWVKAKFFNEPYNTGGPGSSKGGTTSAAPPKIHQPSPEG